MNTNIISDKFNSKQSNNVDWQINGLIGATFRLGKNYKSASSLLTSANNSKQKTQTIFLLSDNKRFIVKYAAIGNG